MTKISDESDYPRYYTRGPNTKTRLGWTKGESGPAYVIRSPGTAPVSLNYYWGNPEESVVYTEESQLIEDQYRRVIRHQDFLRQSS